MIHYVVAVNNSDIFRSYLLPSLEQLKANVAIVSDADNEPVKPSIFKKYNCGIEKTLPTLAPTDVIVFVHEDVKLTDPNFEKKIESVFTQKTNVGILGVVGAALIPESGAWWHNTPNILRGHVLQEYGNGEATHLIKGMIGYYDDLVAVDGLLFAMRGSLFLENKYRFDEDTYKGFHFYDLDTCVSVLECGYRVACADIIVTHRSNGDVSNNTNWSTARDSFITKCRSKNYKFPLAPGKILSNQVSNVMSIEV